MHSDYAQVIQFLKAKYKNSESYITRLTKMVKGSAIVNSFQQEAGNALSVLSYLEVTIQNQNFYQIEVRNSTMNNLRFFYCNFNESKMDNVSIVSAQFIECKFQYVNWINLESSYLNIQTKIKAATFSIQNQILISLHDENTIRFLNLLTGKTINIICKQIKKIYLSVFSGIKKKKFFLELACFGQILVFNDCKRTIYWNIQSKKKIRVNNIKQYIEKSLITFNCQTLAQKSYEKIDIRNIYDNQLISQLISQYKYFEKLSNDSMILIVKGSIQNFSFWEVTNGSETKITNRKLNLREHGLEYKFSPNGKHLAIFQNKTLSVSSIYDELEETKILNQELGDIGKLKFSPDGNLLAIYIQQPGSICVWKIKDQTILQTISYDYLLPRSIKFSPDGEILAFNNSYNKIVLWKFNFATYFHIFYESQLNCIEIIRFSKNNQQLLSQIDGTMRLWDFRILSQHKQLQSNQIDNFRLRSFFISPSNDQLGLVYGNQILMKSLYDFQVKKELNFDLNKINEVIISPDLTKIASYQEDGLIVVRNTYNQEVISQKKFKERIKLEKFSPDGEYLAVSTLGKKMEWEYSIWILKIWKIQDWEEMEGYGEISGIVPFQFSQDGHLIAICCYEYLLVQCIKSKKQKWLIDDQYKNSKFAQMNKRDQSSAVAFSLNGQFLASDSVNNTIRLWNIENGNIISRLSGHLQKISQIYFLNDQMILVSGSYDRSIRIWNALIGFQIQVLEFHESEIINLTVSPDKSKIVTEDQSGALYFWTILRDNDWQLNKMIITEEIQSDYQNFNSMENADQFQLYYVMGCPKFRANKCLIEDSQFFSNQGFSLQTIFESKIDDAEAKNYDDDYETIIIDQEANEYMNESDQVQDIEDQDIDLDMQGE